MLRRRRAAGPAATDGVTAVVQDAVSISVQGSEQDVLDRTVDVLCALLGATSTGLPERTRRHGRGGRRAV